jgi:hypothetical protein
MLFEVVLIVGVLSAWTGMASYMCKVVSWAAESAEGSWLMLTSTHLQADAADTPTCCMFSSTVWQ